MQLGDLELNLAENPTVPCTVADLSTQYHSLTVCMDHLKLTDTAKQFCGVIGQNGELVHDGDFVELNFSRYEVCVCVFVQS